VEEALLRMGDKFLVELSNDQIERLVGVFAVDDIDDLDGLVVSWRVGLILYLECELGIGLI
jgi:hypothetical protein